MMLRNLPYKNSLWFITITLVTGCQGIGNPGFSNPFVGPPPAYKTSYGLTPAQRIEQFTQVASQLPAKTAAEQKQLIQEMTASLAKEQDPLLRRGLVGAVGSTSGRLLEPDLVGRCK